MIADPEVRSLFEDFNGAETLPPDTAIPGLVRPARPMPVVQAPVPEIPAPEETPAPEMRAEERDPGFNFPNAVVEPDPEPSVPESEDPPVHEPSRGSTTVDIIGIKKRRLFHR